MFSVFNLPSFLQWFWAWHVAQNAGCSRHYQPPTCWPEFCSDVLVTNVMSVLTRRTTQCKWTEKAWENVLYPLHLEHYFLSISESQQTNLITSVLLLFIVFMERKYEKDLMSSHDQNWQKGRTKEVLGHDVNVMNYIIFPKHHQL